jgi:50S ribosomal subunit-associated GTPase HflX
MELLYGYNLIIISQKDQKKKFLINSGLVRQIHVDVNVIDLVVLNAHYVRPNMYKNIKKTCVLKSVYHQV